jgi:hypothetical protein
MLDPGTASADPVFWRNLLGGPEALSKTRQLLNSPSRLPTAVQAFKRTTIARPTSYGLTDFKVSRDSQFPDPRPRDSRPPTLPRLPRLWTPRLPNSCTLRLSGLLDSQDSSTPRLFTIYPCLNSSRIASSASITSSFGTVPLRNLSFRLNALFCGR